jgi:hypothetical protein
LARVVGAVLDWLENLALAVGARTGSVRDMHRAGGSGQWGGARCGMWTSSEQEGGCF